MSEGAFEPLLALLKRVSGWPQWDVALKEKKLPQALGVFLPRVFQREFVAYFLHRALCETKTGEDTCSACLAWRGDQHPDVIFCGNSDEPPGIEACRQVFAELYLKPFVADRKWAVFFGVDNLSLPAANSMLKILEEPPLHASLLLVGEQPRLLPTLKSRLWILSISQDREIDASSFPSTDREWRMWFERTREEGSQGILLELEGWIKRLCEVGDFKKAFQVDVLKQTIEESHLSTAMSQDLVFAALKEGLNGEYLFSDFWET